MAITMAEYYAELLGLTDKHYEELSVRLKEALAAKRGGEVQVAASLYTFSRAIKARRKKSFYSICDKLYGLDRTRVERYINVMEEFGNDERTGLSPSWDAWPFGLLVELLTIPPEERHKISPDWSRRNVREFRRVIERRGCDEQEEDAPPPDRFSRFKKWKRSDLCEKILSLEEEIRNLRKED